MQSPISTDTVYNSSTVCKNCQKVVDPVKSLYRSGKKDLCPECTNSEFGKRLKKGLA